MDIFVLPSLQLLRQCLVGYYYFLVLGVNHWLVNLTISIDNTTKLGNKLLFNKILVIIDGMGPYSCFVNVRDVVLHTVSTPARHLP